MNRTKWLVTLLCFFCLAMAFWIASFVKPETGSVTLKFNRYSVAPLRDPQSSFVISNTTSHGIFVYGFDYVSGKSSEMFSSGGQLLSAGDHLAFELPKPKRFPSRLVVTYEDWTWRHRATAFADKLHLYALIPQKWRVFGDHAKTVQTSLTSTDATDMFNWLKPKDDLMISPLTD